MTYTQGVKEQILKYSYKSEDEWAAEMAAVCLCSGYDWDREKDKVKILCTTEETAKRLVRDAKMSGTGLVADGPERVGTRIPGGAPGGTTGIPEVGQTRSSRTSVRSTQDSHAHDR